MLTFSPYSEVPGHGRHHKRSLWGRIWRSPSLAGWLIAAMTVGVVPLASAAQPAVGLTPAHSTTQELGTYLPAFWQQAFGLELDLNNSGMVLTEVAIAATTTLAPDAATTVALATTPTTLWHVDATDKSRPTGQQIVGIGSFEEEYRAEITELAASQEAMTQAGIEEFKHFAVSGFFTGSTGFARHTYGLLLQVEINLTQAGAVGLTVVAFVPFGDASDAAGAQSAAATFRAFFQERVPPVQLMSVAGPPLGRACARELHLCEGAAYNRERAAIIACNGTALAAIPGCGIGCAILGPGYPACLAACLLGIAVGQVTCLAIAARMSKAALLDCKREFIKCQGENGEPISEF